MPMCLDNIGPVLISGAFVHSYRLRVESRDRFREDKPGGVICSEDLLIL